MSTLILALTILCIGIDARPEPCIPINVCTTRIKDMSKEANVRESSQEYKCDSDNKKFLYKYDVADCQGIPKETKPITSSGDDPLYDYIQCEGECKGYIHYREYRLHNAEQQGCAMREKYGYKEHLVTYHCDGGKHLDGNSQKLTCTRRSFRMKWWHENTECKGEPIYNFNTRAGCQNVSLTFYGQPMIHRSYIDMYHCGYAIKDEL